MLRHKALKKLTLPRGGGYTTRHLLPGDVFELANDKNGRLLSRVYQSRRVAVELREPVAVPAPPPAIAEKIKAAVVPPTPPDDPNPPPTPPNDPNPPTPPSADDDLAALRAEYEKAVGRRPFMGWDAVTLREKMAAAKE
jgi:hypothetical protein